MTFSINWIARNTPRAQWLDLYRIIRSCGDRGSFVEESRLMERVEVADTIRRYTEDGQIAVVTSGMDCDCSQYIRSTLRTNLTPVAFLAARDDDYTWADGPINVGLCRPSERPESASRDLAMEAYEDGHPHVVHTAQRLAEGGDY